MNDNHGRLAHAGEKGLVVYSSQNGSTRKVADKIAQRLLRNDIAIDIIALDHNSRISGAGYDFIGIGSPVYMFRPSLLVLDSIDGMGDLNGKPTFTFVTHGSEIDDGANWLRRKLAAGVAVDLGHFKGCGNDLFPSYTS